LAKRKRIPVRAVLWVGLLYQVFVSWHAAYGMTLMTMKQWGTLPAVTFVEVFMMFFPLVIPSKPKYVLLASLLVTATRPLAALAVSHKTGIDLMPNWMFVTTLPPLLTAILATVGARVVYGLGREASQAKQIGSYQLEKKLGQGGMGEVWRASHRMLARPAAVKFIRADAMTAGDDSSGALERFEREAQATAQLSSPHTVKLYDFGRANDGTFYYVMELLEGIDFADLVERYGPVDPQRAIFLLLQVCNSLAEAHAAGMVHRDIKPANVIACRYGLDYDFVKVVDFGLVASSRKESKDAPMLTGANVVLGTPAFLAPEAAVSNNLDHRADIYAVGCLMHWLVAGRLVFEGDGAMALAIAHASQTPPNLSEVSETELPDGMDDIVNSCLAKSPDDRPQSAIELAKRLRDLQTSSPWQGEQAEKWWDEHRPLSQPA
jgi:serine/threonine-protein kinase